MVFIFGVFSRKGRTGLRQPVIIDSSVCIDGAARIDDLLEVVGGCPRFPGDACDLVGGYKSVVIEHEGTLFYRIIA